ncbi:MAG: sulfatase [Planctomycetaceae bacterium]|nr:sulfatase [Planctomycetaceae bacterium]
MIDRRGRLLGGILLLILCLSLLSATPARAASPNIVLILADDLAWSDVGCYGHPWHVTPHIDELAEQGMKFTRGYAPAPICSASRASILTGKTTARLNFEFVTKNEPGYQKIEGETKLKAPAFTLNLPLEEKTIPEYLNELGYQTAFFGKWHLNQHYQRYLGWSPSHGPQAQSFQIAEEDFGGHPYSWGKRTPEPIETPGRFPEDSMIERASNFLEEKHEKPFFLMVSLFHVHTPVRTQCRWLLDKYETRVPADSPARQRRVTYAAFVETLDHYVGQLLKSLDESGNSDETLVVFLSDNGGHPEYTTNAPLRGSKWNLYEGGIRVPFLMRWPGKIKAGTTSDLPVVGYDLLPTFVDLAGGTPDKVDGFDIFTLLENLEFARQRELIFHFPYYHPERGYSKAINEIGVGDFAVSKTHPQSALVRGPHKLIHFYDSNRFEYYDLSDDECEQHSLTDSRPDIAIGFRERLRSQLRHVGARFPTEKED